MDQITSQIRSRLSLRTKKVISEEDFRPAAVLIPIFQKDGELYLLFTLRTDKVASHKGEISFSGGMHEDGDGSLLQTALRETHEEVGIRPDDIEILGELNDLLTVTNYIVTPFVGIIPYPYNFEVNHHEIVELIEIPLSFFLEKKNERTERRKYKGRDVTVYFYDFGRHTVWGVTGRIIKGFVDLIRS